MIELFTFDIDTLDFNFTIQKIGGSCTTITLNDGADCGTCTDRYTVKASSYLLIVLHRPMTNYIGPGNFFESIYIETLAQIRYYGSRDVSFIYFLHSYLL